MNELLQTFSVAVVTGGSSGLGKSFIRLLQTINPRLLICNLSRRKPSAENSPPGARDVVHFPCDLAQGTDVARAAGLVAGTLSREAPTGRVLLVNNSGVGGFGRFPAPGAERQLEIVDVNVRAVVDLTARLLPVLLSRGGGIINIASVHGLVASVQKSAYVAAKHGLIGLTKVTALETATTGVTCNAICPGWVLTPLVQKQVDAKAQASQISIEEATRQLLSEKEPSQQFTTPEELGAMAVFLCSSAAQNVRGAAWNMDGGWAAQ